MLQFATFLTGSSKELSTNYKAYSKPAISSSTQQYDKGKSNNGLMISQKLHYFFFTSHIIAKCCPILALQHSQILTNRCCFAIHYLAQKCCQLAAIATLWRGRIFPPSAIVKLISPHSLRERLIPQHMVPISVAGIDMTMTHVIPFN